MRSLIGSETQLMVCYSMMIGEMNVKISLYFVIDSSAVVSKPRDHELLGGSWIIQLYKYSTRRKGAKFSVPVLAGTYVRTTSTLGASAIVYRFIRTHTIV